MPDPNEIHNERMHSLARELLLLYDEFSEQNAGVLFVMQALAAALAKEDGPDERLALGAAFCVQLMNDRTLDLQRRLKSMQELIELRIPVRAFASVPQSATVFSC